MSPHPVHRQHGQREQDTASQLRNFKNVLEARDEPFKHGLSPLLDRRPFQFFVVRSH